MMETRIENTVEMIHGKCPGNKATWLYGDDALMAFYDVANEAGPALGFPGHDMWAKVLADMGTAQSGATVKITTTLVPYNHLYGGSISLNALDSKTDELLFVATLTIGGRDEGSVMLETDDWAHDLHTIVGNRVIN